MVVNDIEKSEELGGQSMPELQYDEQTVQRLNVDKQSNF